MRDLVARCCGVRVVRDTTPSPPTPQKGGWPPSCQAGHSCALTQGQADTARRRAALGNPTKPRRLLRVAPLTEPGEREAAGAAHTPQGRESPRGQSARSMDAPHHVPVHTIYTPRGTFGTGPPTSFSWKQLLT